MLHPEDVAELMEKEMQAHLKLSTRLTGRERQDAMSEQAMRDYYDDALNATIHMYLCIVRYRKQPRLIAEKLGLNQERLHAALAVLQRSGIIETDSKGLHLKNPVIHLDEESQLSRRNHVNWRLESIKRLQRGDSRSGGYHFSSCFSCSATLLPWINERFKAFVAEAQKMVVASDDGGATEGVYFMDFDLDEVAGP